MHEMAQSAYPIRGITYSSIAQLVEHAAVNRRVVGSSPTGGATTEQAIYRLLCLFIQKSGFTHADAPPLLQKVTFASATRLQTPS